MADAEFLGRGWAFPPSFSPGGGDVATVSGSEDVHQSLRILLSTQPGERVMQEGFGCDLGSLAFEEVDYGFVNRLRQLITNAITLHEPRVDLLSVDVDNGGGRAGELQISIVYEIRSSNSRFNLVFPFYVNEANTPGLSA